jgi:hypothetical protein
VRTHPLKQILCALAVSALLAPAAQAQRRRVLLPPPLTRPRPVQRQDPRPMGSPEAELLKRAEIRHEEENHQEMIERADETARLGVDLRDAFGKYKSLGREDLKRLERMEKLARKIRSRAGGSDDDEKLKDPPAQLDQAVARLAEVSGKLGEEVRKTSRLVVSGAVIEGSNELIELIRHIRTFVKP